MKTGMPLQSRPVLPRLSVDYPQEGEVIVSTSYTFRIDGEAPRVEIAVDGGDWGPCRRGDDFWWFDWGGYDSGRHQALIRGVALSGRVISTLSRRFVVALSR